MFKLFHYLVSFIKEEITINDLEVEMRYNPDLVMTAIDLGSYFPQHNSPTDGEVRRRIEDRQASTYLVPYQGMPFVGESLDIFERMFGQGLHLVYTPTKKHEEILSSIEGRRLPTDLLEKITTYGNVVSALPDFGPETLEIAVQTLSGISLNSPLLLFVDTASVGLRSQFPDLSNQRVQIRRQRGSPGYSSIGSLDTLPAW